MPSKLSFGSVLDRVGRYLRSALPSLLLLYFLATYFVCSVTVGNLVLLQMLLRCTLLCVGGKPTGVTFSSPAQSQQVCMHTCCSAALTCVWGANPPEQLLFPENSEACSTVSDLAFCTPVTSE